MKNKVICIHTFLTLFWSADEIYLRLYMHIYEIFIDLIQSDYIFTGKNPITGE